MLAFFKEHSNASENSQGSFKIPGNERKEKIMADKKAAEKKKPVNGKKKGSDFERRIAKILSESLGFEFHRTPCSGGLHWQKDNRVAGDIIPPPGVNFPFCIELKKHETSWEFPLFFSDKSFFYKFWEQAEKESEMSGLEPVVIFSKNRREEYAVCRKGTAEKLGLLKDSLVIRENLALVPLARFLESLLSFL